MVTSTTPQQSTRGFVAPSAAPVKKTPDITDIIGEKIENVVEKTEDHLVAEKPVVTEEPLVAPDEKKFPTLWQTLFTQIFASIPTIYIPLKDSLPKLENNIITVTVKNEVQKEHFEAKTREILEFLRTHFDEQIENIVVETNELLETKKIIYDVKEKLQNFKEQNPDVEEFLQILDLKIKD